MKLGAPHLLWLALLAPAAAALALALWRRRLAADAAWAGRSLWDRLLPGYAPRRITLSVLTLALAVLGASLALARPRWGAGEQKVERKGVDVVFLVDSSLSMGARDVQPSRLFVAKSLVRRMTAAMPGNRVGLVQTEGDGVTLAPLTLDNAVLDLLLDTIDPGSLPTPGTELASGLATALRLFGQGSEKHRVLVLFSDGEDWGGGLDDAISRLKEAGVVVYAFGVATPDGGPVPIPGTGELKRESDGSVVISRLNEEVLERLARATGGSYLRVTSAAADPAPIVGRIDRMEKRTIESQSLSTREERFQWPLALAALALLVHLGRGPFAPRREKRRAPATRARREPVLARSSLLPTLALLGLAAFPSLPLPWRPHLPVWAERWMYNPRERVERSIAAEKRNQPREAEDLAETALRLAPGDPLVQFDAGTARLGAGDGRRAVQPLEKAAKAAGPELAPAASYNLGNARFAAGDAAGAAEAFKQSLRLEPNNPDAKYNLELALREEQKQKRGGQGKPAGNRGNRSPNQDPSDSQGRGKPDPNQKPQNQQQQQQQQSQGQQQKQQGRPGDSRNSQGQDGQLPQFRNQPEMSGREAASLLSAVENLERQQRRDQVARRARQRSAKGKDW
jgi:Ca-activated chloride channel family protein